MVLTKQVQVKDEIFPATQSLTAANTIDIRPGIATQAVTISAAEAISLTSTPNLRTSGISDRQVVTLINTSNFAITLASAVNSSILSDRAIVLNAQRAVALVYVSALSGWMLESTLEALGAGSIATQSANNVSISGGFLSNTVIGNPVPSAGTFTIVSSTNGFSSNATGLLALEAFRANRTTETRMQLQVGGTNSAFWNCQNSVVQFGTQASVPLDLQSAGTARIRIGSAGRVMVGTQTDDNSNLLQVAGSAKCSQLVLGTKRLNISTTEPTAKTVGDIWWELDASGNYPKWDWYWTYDGATWRSPVFEITQDYYKKAFATTGESTSFFYDAISTLNYQLKEVRINHFSSTAHTMLNRLLFSFNRRIANNTGTQIGSQLSTAGVAASTWTKFTIALNTPVNVTTTSTTLFSFDVTSGGTTGDNFLTTTFSFNYVRP